MKTSAIIARPSKLADVARASNSLAAFGMSLRDWQHEIQRGVRSRPELERRLTDAPPRCVERFAGGDVADAYLAAYAEWLADGAGLARPDWTRDPWRIAGDPWFATSLRGHLLVSTPASFRQRNIFTTPEAVFSPAPGRPKVLLDQKREKARRRQKAYRQRIRALVEKARRMPSDE